MDWNLVTNVVMAALGISGIAFYSQAFKQRRAAEAAVKYAESLRETSNAVLEMAKDKEQRALRLHERALAEKNNAMGLRLKTFENSAAKAHLVSVPTPIGSMPTKRQFDPISTSHAAPTPHRRRSDTDSDWPTVEQRQHEGFTHANTVDPEPSAADPEPFKSGGGGEYSGAGASGSWGDSDSGSSSSTSGD